MADRKWGDAAHAAVFAWRHARECPRIKMPANNRMHSSAALRTTDMWSSVIGDASSKANDAGLAFNV